MQNFNYKESILQIPDLKIGFFYAACYYLLVGINTLFLRLFSLRIKRCLFYSYVIKTNDSMKKNTLLAIAFVATLLIHSCEKKSCNCDEQEIPIQEAPNNIIPVAAADSLYENYGNSRVALIELAENVTEDGDTIPKDDANYKQTTRYVSFSFKEMKKYMAFIEQQADSANIEILQLRVYLGKYGKKVKNKDKSNRGTVFFNPAAEFVTADGTKDTVSFAIKKDAKGNFKAVTVGSVLNGSALNNKSGGENIQSLSENIGHEAPPPPVGGEDFQ